MAQAWLGRLAEARETLERIEVLEVPIPPACYDLARGWAVLASEIDDPTGRDEARERALTALERALQFGFRDLARMRGESPFELLADEPRFGAILERLEQATGL